jgi:NADPH:quinone reductase-like Zn-dependent oxidoreductase
MEVVSALAFAGVDERPAVRDVSPAPLGPGQVRVAVEAASVNGIDASVAAGRLWDTIPHTFPVVLGRDLAGTVEEVGEGVRRFTAGQRVTGVIPATTLGTGTGTFTQQVTVDAGILTPVPHGVSSVQAAAMGLAVVTARDLVATLELTGDDVVLVSGATGGVGAYVVQLAVNAGATVVATARPGDAADFVRRLGAALVVDYTDPASAAAAVAPWGVTAVVHTAGDAARLASLLSPGGRLVSALGVTAEQVGRADITVTPVVAATDPVKLAPLLAEVACGTLKVPVTGTYPLERAADAVADFATHKIGKLVVEVR